MDRNINLNYTLIMKLEKSICKTNILYWIPILVYLKEPELEQKN